MDTKRVSNYQETVKVDTETGMFGIHAAHLWRGILIAQGRIPQRVAEYGSRPGRLQSLAERLAFDTQCQR